MLSAMPTRMRAACYYYYAPDDAVSAIDDMRGTR